MAILVDERSGRSYALAAHCLLGRSPACAVRVDDPRVSGDHARISFREHGWEVRDLGSRNGTFVNGERLERGGSRSISAGDVVALGNAALCLKLADAAPPTAQALRASTGEVLVAKHNVLALPSEDDPVASIFEETTGRWLVEIGGELRPAEDGTILDIRGEPHVLHLPTALVPTAQTHDGATDLCEVELHFRVSRDEERVEVAVHDPAGVTVLPPRAHHYTFLLLARARKRDEEASLPEASCGWVAVDDLCRMLATDENKLNVEVYRIRQDVAALALQNAGRVIERRRGIRQLRLGTPRITIETTAA